MERPFVAAITVLALCTSAVAQNTQKITIKQAVAHNQADPRGAKEIALLNKFAAACDNRFSCSLSGPDHVPSGQFIIQVIYECRDDSGSSRQIGPKDFNGTQRFELNCN